MLTLLLKSFFNSFFSTEKHDSVKVSIYIGVYKTEIYLGLLGIVCISIFGRVRLSITPFSAEEINRSLRQLEIPLLDNLRGVRKI